MAIVSSHCNRGEGNEANGKMAKALLLSVSPRDLFFLL